MKTEDLFLTVEQSKNLQELGLDMSDATFYYVHFPFNSWEIEPKWMISRNCLLETVPTYALQEVLDKLPKYFIVRNKFKQLFVTCYGTYSSVRYENSGFIATNYVEFKEKTLLEAAYKMLCWVLEQGYMGIKEHE